MTFRLGSTLAVLITVAVSLVPPSAGAGHLASPEGGLHEVTGRCLVGVNKEFHTIQSALNFPDPALGETGIPCVYVQPDAAVWREPLLVRRSVTLAGTTFRQGENVFRTTLAPPTDAVGPVALVRIEGRKVRLKVKHIVFQGPLASGDGLIGIAAGKDTRLTIRDSSFFDIRPEPLDGRDGFVAVQVGTPTLPGETTQITFADISAVRMEGFQSAGIVFQGVGTTGLVSRIFLSAQLSSASRTAGQAAPVGIAVRAGAQADILRNDIVNARGPAGSGGGVGIAVSDAARDVTIMENNIDRNDTGIAVDGTREVTIYRNGLDDNGVGLVLGAVSPVTEVVVTSNRVAGGGAGARLAAGTRNVFKSNQVQGSAGVGLAVSDGTSDNLFSRNRADTNAGLGFTDATTGSDRSGTANAWRSNVCHGNNANGVQASPPQLCTVSSR